MHRNDAMTYEEAYKEINDAQNLLRIAYKMLSNVEKKCPKRCCYPLKDVIIDIGTVELALGVIEDDYAKEEENGPK